MTDSTLDELGPVDFVVVEFPPGHSQFTGEMAEELLKLVDAGTIRVIDLMILTKDADGTIEALELSELDDLGPLVRLDRGGRDRSADRSLTCSEDESDA